MTKNPRIIDMTGRRIGLWTVLRQDGNYPGGGALWRCVCDCGSERNVGGADLRGHKSTNCGCQKAEKTGDRARTHGGTGSRLYSVWQNMNKRCNNPRAPRYENYGGRGISICAEWASFEPFREWAVANGYDDALSIERIDVDGNYTPENCTWADAKAQARNRRFVKRAPDGRPWPEVAEEHGVSIGMFNCRRWAGWPPELAATLPKGSRIAPDRKRDDSGRWA